MDKLKIERELSNYKAWLNVLYVYEAVGKSIYNNFRREGHQPALEYSERPHDFNKKPKSKEEIEREERLMVEAKIKERNKQIREMLKNNK